MEHKQVVAALAQIVPRAKDDTEAAREILKYASDNNLAPAQVERLGQMFNAAKTLAVMEKYADDRGRKFSTLDAQDLAQQHEQALAKRAMFTPAAPARNVVAESERFGLRFDFEAGFIPVAQVKAAGAVDSAPAPFVKWANKQDERRHRLSTLETCQFLEDFALDTRRAGAASLEKFAAAVMHERVHSTSRLTRAVEDFNLMAEGSEELRAAFLSEAFSKIAAQLDCDLPDFTATDDRVSRSDRTGLACHLLSAWDNLFLEDAALEHLGEKRASLLGAVADVEAEEEEKKKTERAAGKPQATGGGTRASGLEEPDQEDYVWSVFPHKADGKVPGEDFMRDSLTGLVGGAAAGVGEFARGSQPHLQKGVDVVADQLAGDTDMKIQLETERRLTQDAFARNLLEFELNDPVISAAKPEQVQEFASTLIAIAPRAMRQKDSMRYALREAIQYNSVPIHILRDLADLERSLTAGERDNVALDSARSGEQQQRLPA